LAAFNLGRYFDEGKVIEQDSNKAADLFFTALEGGLDDAVEMFIEKKGSAAAPATLDALQVKLAASGAKFEREKGRLTESAVKALKELSEG
jgi:hypothetical protein